MTFTPRREVVRMNNGARIVFDPMPHLGSAAVGVWVAAGARHEAAERNGLAHFLEHMAFKGAAGRDARGIADTVEARGAALNASTEYERTGYYVRCLASDAPDMLDIALSLVLAPEHPEGEIERERGVVLQEIGEAADQPDDLVFELAQAACFPEHALGRPILGTAQTLASVTRADLFGFAKLNYAPGRTVVAVSGAYDRAAVEATARRWLEDRPAFTQEIGAGPVFESSDARTAARKLEQCHLVLVRGGPGATSGERFAARAFAEIFGGGMASRLFQDVREARGLAYSIDASCDQYSDVGRISVYAGCAPGDAAEVVRITSGIWNDLAANGPSVAELERAKAVMKAGFVMATEAPASRAGSSAYELLTFDRLIENAEVIGNIDAITLDDVRRVAEAAVQGPSVAAAVGPRAGLAAAERFAARAL